MPTFHYFFSELHVLGRGYRYFNWFRQWRFRPLINRIKELIDTEQIDYVIGVYPNALYCQAACIAAQETGTRFSTYFHNTYSDNEAITDPDAERIQQMLFDQSEFVFVMSTGMQDFFQERYQLNNCHPLVHTFSAFPQPSSYSGLPGTEKSTYRLVAIGNFNQSNMDATLRFAASIKDNPRYQLSLFTHVPKMLLHRRGLDMDTIAYEGFVHPEQVHQVLQQYDICVLTHGFTGGYGPIEYRTIFPTRTIPLLLSGKPIIAHAPKNCFLSNFIRKHQCAELVDQASADAILAGLDSITSQADYQQQLVAAAQQTALQFHAPRVVHQLKDLLTNQQTQASNEVAL